MYVLQAGINMDSRKRDTNDFTGLGKRGRAVAQPFPDDAHIPKPSVCDLAFPASKDDDALRTSVGTAECPSSREPISYTFPDTALSLSRVCGTNGPAVKQTQHVCSCTRVVWHKDEGSHLQEAAPGTLRVKCQERTLTGTAC